MLGYFDWKCVQKKWHSKNVLPALFVFYFFFISNNKVYFQAINELLRKIEKCLIKKCSNLTQLEKRNSNRYEFSLGDDKKKQTKIKCTI